MASEDTRADAAELTNSGSETEHGGGDRAERSPGDSGRQLLRADLEQNFEEAKLADPAERPSERPGKGTPRRAGTVPERPSDRGGLGTRAAHSTAGGLGGASTEAPGGGQRQGGGVGAAAAAPK